MNSSSRKQTPRAVRKSESEGKKLVARQLFSLSDIAGILSEAFPGRKIRNSEAMRLQYRLNALGTEFAESLLRLETSMLEHLWFHMRAFSADIARVQSGMAGRFFLPELLTKVEVERLDRLMSAGRFPAVDAVARAIGNNDRRAGLSQLRELEIRLSKLQEAVAAISADICAHERITARPPALLRKQDTRRIASFAKAAMRAVGELLDERIRLSRDNVNSGAPTGPFVRFLVAFFERMRKSLAENPEFSGLEYYFEFDRSAYSFGRWIEAIRPRRKAGAGSTHSSGKFAPRTR